MELVIGAETVTKITWGGQSSTSRIEVDFSGDFFLFLLFSCGLQVHHVISDVKKTQSAHDPQKKKKKQQRKSPSYLP